MTTKPQDNTHPQDPIERFTLYIEGLRRMPVPRGVAGIVHRLLVEFFTVVFTMLAHFAEQCRNGTLPELAPAQADQSAGIIAHSGHSRAGETPGCSTVVAAAGMDSRLRGNDSVQGQPAHQLSGRSEMGARIAETPREMPVVEQPVVRPHHVLGILWTREAAILGFDSKKWALAGGDTRGHLVTY